MAATSSRSTPEEKLEEKGTLELDLSPHDGAVAVDFDSEGRQVLTHLTTLRRQTLPVEGSPWVLCMEDGFGALVGSAQQVLLLEDYLTRMLYKSQSGELFVYERKPDGELEDRPWNLSAKMREYMPGKAVIQHCGAEVKVQVFQLSWPRAGSRLLWAPSACYSIVGMTSYKGQSSKWVYESIPSWQKLLCDFNLTTGHIFKSNASIDKADALASVDKFLPTPAVTTLALLFLLLRWARATPRRGGLRSEALQTKASDFLTSLVVASCVSEWVFDLDFRDDWKVMWPRPHTLGADAQRMHVSRDATVCVKAWQEYADSKRDFGSEQESPKVAWFEELREAVGKDGRVALSDMLLHPGLAMSETYQPMLLQLLWHIANRIELVGYKSLEVKGDFAVRLERMPQEELWGAREVDKTCVRHREASKVASRGMKYIGIGFDKVNSRSLDLQNAFCVLPTNQAFECIPQVVSHANIDSSSSPGKDLEKAADMQKRHKRFIEKDNDATGNSFRPRKRFRMSTEKVLCMLDNQVRTSTEFGGLKYFRPQGQGNDMPHWSAWNHLSVSCDQGSDVLSGVHSMLYFPQLQVNLTPYWDPSHGANRDYWCAVSDVSGKGFLLCTMIVLNLPHGPEETDLRHSQIRDCMLEHFRLLSPSGSPLFQQLSPAIMKERGNEIDPEMGESSEQALWRLLEAESMYRVKGTRVNIARFFSVVADSLKLLRRWSTMLFEVAVPAIELGMLSSATLPHIQLRTKGADPDANPETTSKKKLSTDERSLRAAGANALVIAFSMLAEKNNRRSLAILVLVARPTMEFHASTSKQLRDVKSSQLWLLDQVRGIGLRHIMQTLETLADLSFLEDSGFLHSPDVIRHMSNDEVQHDNDFASYAGAFAVALAKYRLKRCLYMILGYPHSCALLLGTPQEQSDWLQRVKADAEIYEELKSARGPSTTAKLVLERSPFNVLAVRQLLLACRESNFRLTQPIREMVSQRTLTLMQSQGVEDLNNWQKNAKQENNWGGRYRRPQTGLAVCVRKRVLQEVHNFDSVATDMINIKGTEPLTTSDMCATKPPSLPFSDVTTAQQKAPYWSPVAELVGQPTADLQLLRDRKASGVPLGQLSGVDTAFWCDAAHKVAFRAKPGRGRPSQWYVGLFHYRTSACLVWPVKVLSLPGDGDKDYLVWEVISSPVILAISSMDGYEAFSFEFKSWSWQSQCLEGASALQPAVRAFREGPIGTLPEVAARAAWWGLSRSVMEGVGEQLGIDMTGATSLFDVAYKLTQGVLKTSGDATYTVLEKRMLYLAKTANHYEDILKVDEAAKLLREEDRTEIDTEKRRYDTQEGETKQFRSTFRERRASARPKSGAATKAVLKEYTGPSKLPPNLEHMKQADLKKLVPPGGYLWRARNSNSWNARYQQFPVRSCRDAVWGERGAIVQCLRHAWEWWADCKGLAKEQSPIKNLWDASFDPAAAASSSSSTT